MGPAMEIDVLIRVFRFTSKSEYRFEAWGAHADRYDIPGSPIDVWCIELTSSGHFWSFPTCLKMVFEVKRNTLVYTFVLFGGKISRGSF